MFDFRDKSIKLKIKKRHLYKIKIKNFFILYLYNLQLIVELTISKKSDGSAIRLDWNTIYRELNII